MWKKWFKKWHNYSSRANIKIFGIIPPSLPPFIHGSDLAENSIAIAGHHNGTHRVHKHLGKEGIRELGT